MNDLVMLLLNVDNCSKLFRSLAFYLITSLSIITSIGCETEFNYNPVDEPIKTVLYSFLEEDSILEVNLSQSVIISTEGDREAIPNGTLSVYVDSVLMTTKMCGCDTGWIKFPNITVKASSIYQFSFSAPDFAIVKATALVPKSLTALRVDTLQSILLEGGKIDTVMGCKITFNDSLLVPNYYQLAVYQVTQEKAFAPIVRTEISFTKSDKIFLSASQSSGIWKGIDFQGLFTDESIDGKVYSISLLLPTQYFENEEALFYKGVDFVIYSLSYDYFEFYRSRKIAEGYQGIPFLDPVQVYSNVENGLGCVGGLSCIRSRIDAVSR